MLCFFMFFLMTVSSAPLGLMHGKQASKHVAEIMSHHRLSQALFQNKTFLSELVEADPETLNTILGHLNDLLAVSQAASLAFTTDVSAALSVKRDKSAILGKATSEFDVADLALEVAQGALTEAQGALTEATSEFDVASSYHTAMVDELNDKQPGVDAETETLLSTKVLIETLIPAGIPAVTVLAYVPESSRSYSSAWHNGDRGHATSMLSSPQAWSAAVNRVGEWILMDIGSVQTVLGVVVAGRGNGGANSFPQWVTSFTVATSIDGVTFTDETSAFSSALAQADYNFDNAVSARYVRITVLSWHNHISLRADVLIAIRSAPYVHG